MKKKLIIILCFISFVILIFYFLDFRVIVPISEYKYENRQLEIGDTINPLENFDLKNGRWSAYIVLSQNDFKDIDPAITKTRCLKTTDIKLLRKMQDSWNFIYKASDIATVESSIYIFNGKKLVFESGIILDKNKQGLQSESFGWIEPVNSQILIECCKEFKRVSSPIVFL